jgi:hypothetical protein
VHVGRRRGGAERDVPGEIELSRPYAGIHYRFDIDAGLSLGERVARVSLDADAKGRLVTSLR